MAEQLAKVVKQVVDAEAEAARRGALLRAVEELQGARAECAWLCAYDADDARYKARHLSERTLTSLASLPLPPITLALSHAPLCQDWLSRQGVSGAEHIHCDSKPHAGVWPLPSSLHSQPHRGMLALAQGRGCLLAYARDPCDICAAAHSVVWCCHLEHGARLRRAVLHWRMPAPGWASGVCGGNRLPCPVAGEGRQQEAAAGLAIAFKPALPASQGNAGACTRQGVPLSIR